MIRLRDIDTKEVLELDEAAGVQLIDGLHYTETGEVKHIGALTPLREFRAFDMVQVDTGIDDDKQPRILAILPKRKDGVAMFIASTLMALSALGCSGATYSYSYTCTGSACPVPPAPPMWVNYPVMPTQAYVPTHVQYVDRPMEIRVHDDGRSEIERRPARPRVQ